MTLFAFLSLVLSSVLLVYNIELIMYKKKMNPRLHLYERLRRNMLHHLASATLLLLFASLYGVVSVWDAAILFFLSFVTFTTRDAVLMIQRNIKSKIITMQTIRDQYLTARKKHTCSACGCVIEKGAFYRRQTVADGEIYDWLSHTECNKAMSLLGMFDDVPNGEGITGEEFRGYVDGYLHDNGIPCEGMDMFQKVKTAVAHARAQNKNIHSQTQLQFQIC